MLDTKSLENTITFIVGDHGIHYGKYFNELENSFPPLIIVYDAYILQIANKKLLNKYQSNSLEVNQNRLVTPYHLFHTLKYISKGFKTNNQFTLFKKIPTTYNCKESKIEIKCKCIQSYNDYLLHFKYF